MAPLDSMPVGLARRMPTEFLIKSYHPSIAVFNSSLIDNDIEKLMARTPVTCGMTYLLKPLYI